MSIAWARSTEVSRGCGCARTAAAARQRAGTIDPARFQVMFPPGRLPCSYGARRRRFRLSSQQWSPACHWARLPPVMTLRRRLAPVLAASALLGLGGAGEGDAPRWIGTWAAAPQAFLPGALETFQDRT